MSLRFRSLTVRRIWQILQNTPAWVEAFTANRQILQDGEDWLKDQAWRAPHDFPHVWITTGDRSSGNPFPVRTFDDETSGVADYEQAASEIRLRIVYEDEQQATPELRDALELGTIEAMRAEGRTLGLAYVAGWTYAISKQRAMVDGNERPVVIITFAVQYEFEDASVLLPAAP